MADAGLPDGNKPVSQWTDEQLLRALVALGSTAVGVTPSTRGFLERKVERLLLQKGQSPAEQDTKETESPAGSAVESPVVAAHPSLDTPARDGEFYGVSVQGEGTPGQSSLSPFYTTRSEALRAIKSVPGARFKKFRTQASAEAFSRSPVSSPACVVSSSSSLQGESPAEPTSGEKPNLFPSLKTQDLSKLKSLIDAGDVTGFSREVWANPRYLVNCYGDAPEILHVGCRYNALHCAVRAGNLEICQVCLCCLMMVWWCIQQYLL